MKIMNAKLLFSLLLLPSILFLPCPRAGAQTSSAAARITQAVDENNLVVLKGNVHPQARAEFDQGAVSDGQPLHRMLLLLQRSAGQEAALQKLLDDQQNKSSANYHAWLTPAQFGQQFGPADADIQTVTNWLQSHGFQITKVTAGRTLIEFSGNAAQVRSAFHTAIHKYLVNGEAHMANTSDPQIPSALAPVVAGPVSLNNFPVKSHMRQLGTFQKSVKTGQTKPLFTFPGCESGSCYGMGPADFATIYNTAPLLTGTPKIDGTGQSIAIVGESNINPQDVIDFRTMFGLPQNFSSSNIILNGADPGINGSESESDLDVQWSGAVAPGATIQFVTSEPTETTAGIDLSAIYIIENNLAGVMSESFGGCEQELGTVGNAFYSQMWEQAATQGITVLISAGDGGSAGCDDFDTAQTATLGLAVSGYASTPYNVAVGGTDFDQINRWSQYWNTTNTSMTQASALGYIPEIPWNDSCGQLGINGCGASAPQGSLNIVAGSGGVSTIYSKPSWQSGTGVPLDSHRDLPDVSLFASSGFNGSFYIYCQIDVTAIGGSCNLSELNYTFQGAGGTSVSTPAFAGILALVNQNQATAQNPAPRQGNANYVLYQLFKKQLNTTPALNCNSSSVPAAGCTFNDVTHGNSALANSSVGNNDVPCIGGSTNCSSKTAGTNGVLVTTANPTTPAYSTTTGYDLATGLGSENAANLVNNWGSVTFLPSTTTLSATVNGSSVTSITGITHGTPVNVSSSVAAGQGATGTPTGQVVLTATPNPTPGNISGNLGIEALALGANGNASGTGVILPGGTYNLTAHYQGDGTFGTSDSAPGIPVNITAEASKTLISIPVFNPNTGAETSNTPTSLMYGSPYIARIDVGNAQAKLSYPPQAVCIPPACPTGTITWTDSFNGAPAAPLDGGIFALNSAGHTEDQTIQLPGGTHVLSASYSGDDSFSTSIGTYSLTLTPAPTTIGLYGGGTLPIFGQPLQVSINGQAQTPTGVAPTGTVSFFDGATQLGNPVPVAGVYATSSAEPSFTANANLLLTHTGSQTLTASYSGDANYAASTSAPLSLNALIQTSFALSANSTSVQYGANTVLTATVTTNIKGPAITGSIIFLGSMQGNLGTVTQTIGTDANGNATIQATVTTILQVSQTVQAGYSGDPNYASSGSMISIQVNIPDFTLGPAGGITVDPIAGQPGSGQFTVTPVTQTPSTVTLALSPIVISGYTISLGSPQVNLNGSAVNVALSMTPVSAPSANLESNARHALVIPSGKQEPRPLGFSIVLAVLFLFGFATPRLRRRTVLAGSLAVVLACTTSCGGGSGGGGEVPPPPQPQATTITLTTSNAKVGAGQPLIITATVTSSSTQPLTGTITFYNFGTSISGAPIANGQAQTGQGYINNPGLYSITASYSGDADNLASTTAASLTQVLTGTFPASIQASTGGDVHSLQVVLGVQ
jgi:hypothetical protein